MKENFTSINVIIDQSGSMASLTNDTIGSFNSFLKDQKELPGEAVFTLCLFNHQHDVVYNCLPLADVPDLSRTTYKPSGSTALLDAMGQTINSVGAKLAALPEEERPDKVIFLIITDGEENASKSFTREQVKDMVTHQTEKYNWKFVFLAANMDAISEGTSLGIGSANSYNYDASSQGTKRVYASVSRGLVNYRSSSQFKDDDLSRLDPNIDFVGKDDDEVE